VTRSIAYGNDQPKPLAVDGDEFTRMQAKSTGIVQKPAASRARGVDDAPIFFELSIVARRMGLYSYTCYALPNIRRSPENSRGRKACMALPANFSLLHSELNDFLFAELGEEENGLPLSVLSALTRLGADPWAEGARLSELPRDAAARALVTMIAMFPREKRGFSEVMALAEKLAGLLPRRLDDATGIVATGDRRRAPGPAMPVTIGSWWEKLARVVDDLRSPGRLSILTWVALAVCAAIFASWLSG
jgi:hypothetical protein